MNRPTAVAFLALFALLGLMGLAGASLCPPAEGPTECRGTYRLGAKLVCEEAVPLPGPETAAPATASPSAVSAPRTAVPIRVLATEAAAVEICFPVADWNGTAPAEDRPCTSVTRPYEDGSGRLTLGTVGADAANCVIPNVYEERGRFAIHCKRVPNR